MSERKLPRLIHFIPAYGRSVDPQVWAQGYREGFAAAALGLYEPVPNWLDKNGVDMSRNRCLEAAIAAGIDWVFMQDADVWGETAVIPRLLDIATTHDATAVAMAVGLRREGAAICVSPFKPGEVYPGELAGSGMILINVRHLAEFRREGYAGPFFARTYADRAQTELGVGGDCHFTDLIKRLGGSLWIDAGQITVHRYTNDSDLRFDPAAGVTAADEAPGSRKAGGAPDA